MPKRYLVIDTETTGLDPARDLLLEVCLLKIEDGAVTGRFDATIHRPRVGGDPEALIMHAGSGTGTATTDSGVTNRGTENRHEGVR